MSFLKDAAKIEYLLIFPISAEAFCSLFFNIFLRKSYHYGSQKTKPDKIWRALVIMAIVLGP
ncbi:MAG TPA: hypothetical protein DDW62_13215 [Marinilabiliaceae bacterium]|jgi:hypothetical protein|nr:hypothetical protein [Marinilabiliaceae bacterium]